MPLLSVDDRAYPGSHDGCVDEATSCIRCSAHRYLTEEDWAAVSFYGKVQDQSVNLTPMGVADGPAVLAPRLEGWVAACKLYGIPKADRADLIDVARAIFEGVHGRVPKSATLAMTLDELSDDVEIETVPFPPPDEVLQ